MLWGVHYYVHSRCFIAGGRRRSIVQFGEMDYYVRACWCGYTDGVGDEKENEDGEGPKLGDEESMTTQSEIFEAASNLNLTVLKTIVPASIINATTTYYSPLKFSICMTSLAASILVRHDWQSYL